MERIKEVGPDRACTEWLLRCGAGVRWKGEHTLRRDLIALTAHTKQNRGINVIEEIEAIESTIMDVGFAHFDGCKHIQTVRLSHLLYFSDHSLALLVDKLQHSLEHLALLECGDITESGLSALTNLRLLKTLRLKDLPEIKNKKKCFERLQQDLPNGCTIDFNDLK